MDKKEMKMNVEEVKEQEQVRLVRDNVKEN